MARVSATRKELLAHKSRIQLASQGREMLEQKRTALMRELLQVADRLVGEAEEMERAAAEARAALSRAETLAGPEAVRSAALAARRAVRLKMTTTNVMGVWLPEIEPVSLRRSMIGRGYAITGTSTTIDEAAEAFEVEAEAILEVADRELRLRRLASEISALSRRVNALEQVLIPRLESQRDYIAMVLEERERDTRYRLKLAKRLIERKQAG